MLIIQRSVDESFTVKTPSGDYTVMVTKVNGGRVFLGITAPREWPIHRGDIKKVL